MVVVCLFLTAEMQTPQQVRGHGKLRWFEVSLIRTGCGSGGGGKTTFYGLLFNMCLKFFGSKKKAPPKG
jgi:hypothetical protein